MKRFRIIIVLLGILMIGVPQLCMAEEEIEKEEKDVFKVGEIQVTAPREKEAVVVAPSTTTINVDEYEMPGIPQNIVDILKDRAIIDFRGETDLVPDDDTIFMRGFSASRFATAIDGLTVQKTGGRKSSHIVDYALLPTWLIEKIEIMPGPHSALYPGKSIGGVLNLITKTPKKYPTLKPDVNVTTSYQLYNTQNHHINLRSDVHSFTYDDEWYFTEVQIDPYHMVDFGMMKDACLKFYIKNLFDEEYQDASGYPATDRTYGVALSFRF